MKKNVVKKLLAGALASAMILGSLAGCGGGSSDSGKSKGSILYGLAAAVQGTMPAAKRPRRREMHLQRTTGVQPVMSSRLRRKAIQMPRRLPGRAVPLCGCPI